MKSYESEFQIVFRGINRELITEHLDSNIQKILCVYDTANNFLTDLRKYNSDRLSLYEIYEDVKDEWIVEKHKMIENDQYILVNSIN